MPMLIRDLVLQPGEPEEMLRERAARRLGLPADAIRAYAVVRRAIDARRQDRVAQVFNVELALKEGVKAERRAAARRHRPDVQMLLVKARPPVVQGASPLRHRPVVVGFGPAGMFAALALARQGYSPIVLERGRDVRTRHRDVMQRFYREHDFDPESNLLFGEGGAGAYSDGKLYTRVNDPLVQEVLAIFFQHGAKPDILIDGRPHVGSDKLPGICRNIRVAIEAAGGEVRFGQRVDDVEITDGSVTAVQVGGERVATDALILCIGHSARDTVRMLARHGVRIEAKPFQFGVRVEHPQKLVDQWQYGAACGRMPLPPADYHLVARGAAGAMGDVFSFCMCPGGIILPTNESHGLIATNGASRASRGGPLANSGLVVTVPPEAFGNDPLAGLAYVEGWERAAFELTGRTYEVPAQRGPDFIAGRMSDGELVTSYPLGGRWADLRRVMPEFVGPAIGRALHMLDERHPGFAGPEMLVTGPESRASAPIRIPRHDDTRESINVSGLYPVGEGAGYAGGIISAAVDGIRTAEAVVARFAPVK